MNYSIAIDGPAGAGKSTIAKKIAKQLGFIYVDTGAMYRAIGLYFLRENVDNNKEDAVKEAISRAHVTIQYENGEQIVILNNENVNGLIRTPEVGTQASNIAKLQPVREKLVELQRNLAKTTSVIMDGRDIGTHVLPDATLKIYLTASSKERAKRRYTELKEKGIDCTIDEIEQEIISRDNQDMNRAISPLVQAKDAILVDSSTMTIDEVVNTIIKEFKENEMN